MVHPRTPSDPIRGIRRMWSSAVSTTASLPPTDRKDASVPGGGAFGRSKRLAAQPRGSQRVSPYATTQGMLAAVQRSNARRSNARRNDVRRNDVRRNDARLARANAHQSDQP